MSSVQDDNSQEVLNQTYSSKDFAKDAISLQSASVDEIVSRSQSPDWECIHKLTSPK